MRDREIRSKCRASLSQMEKNYKILKRQNFMFKYSELASNLKKNISW